MTEEDDSMIGNCPLCGQRARIVTDLDGEKHYFHFPQAIPHEAEAKA